MNQLAFSEPVDFGSMSQKERVLWWLEEHGTITQNDGKEYLGIGRVDRPIYYLRKDGHKITTIHEEGTNRYGHKITYARYKLITDGELF